MEGISKDFDIEERHFNTAVAWISMSIIVLLTKSYCLTLIFRSDTTVSSVVLAIAIESSGMISINVLTYEVSVMIPDELF